jgi:hypothetical protein
VSRDLEARLKAILARAAASVRARWPEVLVENS